MRNHPKTIAWCIIMTLCAIGAVANEPAEPVDPGKRVVVSERIIGGDTATTSASQPERAGLVAVRDAETGELRAPTASEWQELASTFDVLNRSDQGLVERTYSDGSVGVRLEGRFQSVSMINRSSSASGEDVVEATCTHSADTVVAKLASTEAAAESQDDDETEAAHDH